MYRQAYHNLNMTEYEHGIYGEDINSDNNNDNQRYEENDADNDTYTEHENTYNRGG